MIALIKRFLSKSQMSLFDWKPKHEEVHHREGTTRHTASGATVQVASTMAKVMVRGKEGHNIQPHPDKKVYYKLPGQARKKKGTVVSGNHDSGYVIQPVRQGSLFRPPQITVHRDHIWTPEEHTAESETSGTRVTTSRGGSTIAPEESRRRLTEGQSRARINETEVMQHPEFVSHMQRTLRGLASRNGYNPNYTESQGVLHNDDPDSNELYSEYATAAMNAFRTETSRASQEDLDEFRRHLAGEKQDSRIMMSISRSGKTAAIRHTRRNVNRLREESSYDGTMEDDQESGMRSIAAQRHNVPEHEGTLARRAQLERGITDQLDALDDPVAAAMVKMKFGLGHFEHGYGENQIAAAMNRANMTTPGQDGPWTKETVKAYMTASLARLARTRGAQSLLGLLKSLKERNTLRKSEERQKTICVDFDGVIADYSKGWQGAEVFGSPMKGAAEGMKALRDAGWKIIVFTTRQASEKLQEYLVNNDIPFDSINVNSDQPEGCNPGKPIADVYLDDRALRFANWNNALESIERFTKSLRADFLMDRFMLIKSHIRQYARQDGTVVQEHDDKRVKKHQDVLKHQNEHGEEIHTGAKLAHGDDLIEHLKSRGWKEREVHQVKPAEGHKGGKKEEMPEHDPIPGKNRENGALQTAERAMKKMWEAAKASDDPASVLQSMNTSRSNTYTKAVDDYREKLLNHFGHKVDRDSTATKYEKDGHTIILSKDGDKHTVHFAGGDPEKAKGAVTSIQGKREVQAADTGKKEPKFIMGKPNKAYTAKMNEVRSKYALVEADDLTASHTIQGHINRAYPQEIQPRERERLSSQMQMANMMNDIKPELFGAGNRAADGAPIVGKDGAVESGNGRTIALTEAYNRGLADHYKGYLKSEAESFGLKPEDVERMQHPVLVRVRDDDDPNTDRAEFAREANDTGNLGSSPAEQAWSDAGRIDDALLKKFTVDEDGEIYNDDNMDFINGFLDKLAKNEAASLRDSDGDPNKKCIERIQNAVFTKVYGSSMLTELQAESAKPKIRNILKALNGCVGDFAQVRGHDDLDVIPDMMEAIEYTLSHQGQSRAELEHTLRNAGALDFTGDTPKFKTDHAINMILAIADRTGSRSRMENVFKAISNEIKNEVASRENPEVDMFSGPAEPKSKEQVVKQALDRVNSGDESVRKSLCRSGLHLIRKSHGGNNGDNDGRRKVPAQGSDAAKGTGVGGRDGRGRREESDSRPEEGSLRKSSEEGGGGQSEGETGGAAGRDSRRTGGSWLIKSHVQEYYRMAGSGAVFRKDEEE